MGVGRDVDHAGALVVAVDVVAIDRGFDLVEVLEPELFEQLDLVGEAGLPFATPCVRLDSMNPPLRPLAADPTSWASISTTSCDGVALLGDDRRPQAGVTAADDAQVAVLGAHQRRVRVGLVGVVVPVRVRVGVGDRVEIPLADGHRRPVS